MEVYRGANLVEMSLLSFNACPFSWFSEEKKNL